MEEVMSPDRSVTVPFSLAVQILTMLKEHDEKNQFVAFSREKGNILISEKRSDAFRRALAQYSVPDSVAVERLTAFIEELISTGQASQFALDENAALTVPEVTYMALKQFIDRRGTDHPFATHALARSIVGTGPANCPNFRCPHSL